MLLAEIRSHAGCETVFAVEVVLTRDPGFETNWKIGKVGSRSADPLLTDRAAKFTMTRFRHQYNLIDA
ncbi:MAG: hypothetical protein JWR80_4594 [Bradyrhizobium sp.]|nr:hypothetical protein [Bradyrhizobium sp.]